jgi:hypothetical protein
MRTYTYTYTYTDAAGYPRKGQVVADTIEHAEQVARSKIDPAAPHFEKFVEMDDR